MPYLSHISVMTYYSFNILFLVSILHSSQKTRLSLLLGSECVSKHFLQIECPHNKVYGSFRYSKQLKQLRVLSKSNAGLVILSRSLKMSFFMFSRSITFYSEFLKFSTTFSYFSFSLESWDSNVFPTSIRAKNLDSRSL